MIGELACSVAEILGSLECIFSGKLKRGVGKKGNVIVKAEPIRDHED